MGFPLGKRETSLGKVGGKAVTTVPLSGGSADPVGSLRKGGCRGGSTLGQNESVFQSQDRCKGRAPQRLHREEACPQQCPQQCPLLLRKDRTRARRGVASSAGCGRAKASRPVPERCVSEASVHPATSSAFWVLVVWSFTPVFAGKLVALAISRELSELRSPELSVIVSSAPPTPRGLGGRGTAGPSRCRVAEAGWPPPGGCVCERGVN